MDSVYCTSRIHHILKLNSFVKNTKKFLNEIFLSETKMSIQSLICNAIIGQMQNGWRQHDYTLPFNVIHVTTMDQFWVESYWTQLIYFWKYKNYTYLFYTFSKLMQVVEMFPHGYLVISEYFVYNKEVLTHWGWDKWRPFGRRNFHMQFLEWWCLNLNWNFIEV